MFEKHGNVSRMCLSRLSPQTRVSVLCECVCVSDMVPTLLQYSLLSHLYAVVQYSRCGCARLAAMLSSLPPGMLQP